MPYVQYMLVASTAIAPLPPPRIVGVPPAIGTFITELSVVQYTLRESTAMALAVRYPEASVVSVLLWAAVALPLEPELPPLAEFDPPLLLPDEVES